MSNPRTSTKARIEPAALAQGSELYHSGNYTAAEQLFAQLPSAEEDSGALRMLGLCRLHIGKTTTACNDLARAHALATIAPETRLHDGLALLQAGQAAAAAHHFRACIPLLPHDPAPLVNLAATLLHLGDTTGALLAARRARLRAPRLPAAHYTMGLAAMAAGELRRAAEHFRKATDLDPRFAEAWINLGVARYRQWDVAGVRMAMQRAIEASPDHPVATANLAGLLRLSGGLEASQRLLQDIVDRGGEADAEARFNLAWIRLDEGKPEQALALLDRPSPKDQDVARYWHLQRILAHLQLGQLDEARRQLDGIGPMPPPLAPLLLWRKLLLAQANGNPSHARIVAEQMEAALANRQDVLPEHRIMGCFDLAGFWAADGEPDRAFPLWAEAIVISPGSSHSPEHATGRSRTRPSVCSAPSVCDPRRAQQMPIPHRCSSSACRALAPRSSSRSSLRIPRHSGPANGTLSRESSRPSAALGSQRTP